MFDVGGDKVPLTFEYKKEQLFDPSQVISRVQILAKSSELDLVLVDNQFGDLFSDHCECQDSVCYLMYLISLRGTSSFVSI